MVSTTFSSILKEEKEDKNDFRFCCRHMTYLLHELRLDELLHDCTWFHVRGRSTTKWIKLYPNLTPYPQGHVKGQIKPKAGLARRRFSQKTNQQICFVCCEKQKSKQNLKQIRWFIFWENRQCPNLLSVLSDLYMTPTLRHMTKGGLSTDPLSPTSCPRGY